MNQSSDVQRLFRLKTRVEEIKTTFQSIISLTAGSDKDIIFWKRQGCVTYPQTVSEIKEILLNRLKLMTEQCNKLEQTVS